ncbi:hypothetical protein OF83DRAFT_1061554, partial [Amylostereum chailletii]
LRSLQPQNTHLPHQNAFSRVLRPLGANFYEMFVPDILHEFDLGVWKSNSVHLMWLLYAVRDNGIQDLNKRFVHFIACTLRHVLTSHSTDIESRLRQAWNPDCGLSCVRPDPSELSVDVRSPKPHDRGAGSLAVIIEVFVLAEAFTHTTKAWHDRYCEKPPGTARLCDARDSHQTPIPTGNSEGAVRSGS